MLISKETESFLEHRCSCNFVICVFVSESDDVKIKSYLSNMP